MRPPPPPLTDAQREIVDRNRGLVYQVLHTCSFVPRKDSDEYLSAGFLGLIGAVRNFRPELGYRFATYACQSIRREMQRWHVENRTIHVPHYQFGMDKRQGRYGEHARAALQIVYPDGQEDPWYGVADTREDNLPPDDEVRSLYEAIERLPRRWRWIIEERLRGSTLEQIGEALRITRERVRQIERAAHRRLKFYLTPKEAIQ